jgi:outer membrane immunogenic protein
MAGAGLLAVAMASPSFAADLPRPAYKAPAYIAPFSWTGFYVGVNGGYGWGKSNWSNAALSDNLTTKGALLGGTIGYNLQTGVWVFGLEGDFDWTWIKGSDNTAGGICGGTVGCQTKNTWLSTGRGRIGYAWDRWLPYITGGAAYGAVKMLPNPGTNSETENRFGWTAGVGVEYAFLGAWSAKLEYLYVDLGKATCDAAPCGIPTTVTDKTNLVRLGVNYRF